MPAIVSFKKRVDEGLPVTLDAKRAKCLYERTCADLRRLCITYKYIYTQCLWMHMGYCTLRMQIRLYMNVYLNNCISPACIYVHITMYLGITYTYMEFE